MKTLREILRLLVRNWRPLVVFELVFRSALALLLVPLFRLPLDGLMHLTGRYYLSWNNLPVFLSQPIVILSLLLAVLVLSAFAVFDVSAILLILDQSREDVRVTVREASGYALRQAVRAFHPRCALMPLYTLVLIPFLNMGISVGAVRALAIPEFVQEFIDESSVLPWVYAAILALLLLLFLRLLYLFPAFVLEGRGLLASCRRSFRLSHGHLVGDLLAVGGIQAVVVVAAAASTELLVRAGLSAADLLSGSRPALAVCVSALLLLGAFVALVGLGLSTAVGYACVLVRYWQHVRQLGETIPDPEPPSSRSRHMRATLWRGHGVTVAIGVYCALVALCSFGLYQLLGHPDLVDELFEPLLSRSVEVTAHRGASDEYPENTMPAFRAAKAEGADWCELDVQQTSDGVIFVSHDSNLKRISGVDKNAYELTWDEVSQLDAGSYLSSDFAGTRYPKLEEVVSWAKDNGMRLNIELKPTGHEQDLEKDVADIIHTADFEDRCIVTSQNYEAVEEMKREAPDITTAYVMALAYGDICELGAADIYSVEETSCSRVLVDYVHANGKQVLAWTVNSDENMQRVISNGVDNLITDDVRLGREAVEEASQVSVVDQLVDQVIGIFA